MKKLLLSVLVATAFGAQAGETTVDAFMFHEVMPEGDAVKARYYFNDRYMRVDEGSDTADFALFDREEGAFYSVVHSSKSVTVIQPNDYDLKPYGPLESVIAERPEKDIPQVAGQSMKKYQTFVNGALCETVYAAEAFPRANAVFKDYKSLMAQHQKTVYEGTPPEFQNDCMSSALVFYPTLALSKGFPVFYERNQGEKRQLMDYKLNLSVDDSVFQLPEGYRVFNLEEIPDF